MCRFSVEMYDNAVVVQLPICRTKEDDYKMFEVSYLTCLCLHHCSVTLKLLRLGWYLVSYGIWTTRTMQTLY